MSDTSPLSPASPSSTSAWSPSIFSAVAACVLGGVLGLGIASSIDPAFPYPDLRPVPQEPSAKDKPLIELHQKARGEFYSHNYAVSFAILGACLGGAVGLFTTRTRRLPSAFVGALLAAVAGAGVSMTVGTTIGVALEQSKGFSLVEAGGLHLSTWGAMIAALALGIGWIRGGAAEGLKCGLSGAIASVLAVMVYLIAASALFLDDNMGRLIPLEIPHKTLWILTCTALVGLLLAVALRPSAPKKA